MSCKWCGKELSDKQIYSYLRGKSKGSACSSKCSMLLSHYGTPDELEKRQERVCQVCNSKFKRPEWSKQVNCSVECGGKVSSERMKRNNPMKKKSAREAMSKTLKKIGHKPKVQGGNGRGLTKHQSMLFCELIKLNKDFVNEYAEKTGDLMARFKAPTHYKIDIADPTRKIAIEVDGFSHQSIKVKECDQRKTELLSLKGWKVLRFTNSQIEKELKKCVQTVMCMI